MKVIIDKKEFETEQYISGKTIKRLAGISEDAELFANQRYMNCRKPVWRAYLLVSGTASDREIGDTEIIDVGNPSTRKFFTANVGTLEF